MAKKKKPAKPDSKGEVDETPATVGEAGEATAPLDIDNGLIDTGEAAHVVIGGKIVETHTGVGGWRVAVERYRALTNK